MNILYHVVTNNLNNNKYQSNESINSDLKFDTSNFNLSSVNSNPLPVVTISLRGGNKHRAMTVASIICLWDSESTDSIIKRQHTNHYERKIRSNKVDYSTADGMYCTTHYVKVPFCMPEFSISKIINRLFHIESNKRRFGNRLLYDHIP